MARRDTDGWHQGRASRNELSAWKTLGYAVGVWSSLAPRWACCAPAWVLCILVALTACSRDIAKNTKATAKNIVTVQHASKPVVVLPTANPEDLQQDLQQDLKYALRRQDWVRAEQLMERMPNANSPELQFARLFAAQKNNSVASDVTSQLKDLGAWQEGAPLVKLLQPSVTAHADSEPTIATIKRLPFDALAAQTREVLSLQKLTDEQKLWSAKALVRLLQLSRRRKARQPTFRELRAQFRTLTGHITAAAADWTWLAVYGPSSHHLETATSALNQLPGRRSLRGATLLSRSHQRAEAGDVEGVEQALNIAQSLNVSVKPGLRYYRLGLAHYRSRDYKEAAPLLEAASKSPNRHAAQGRYYAANAWSRLARSDKAIALYRRAANSPPRTTLNERAQLQLAREYRFVGKFPEAIRAYRKFLARHPNTPRTQSAHREYGVTQFLLGYKKAAAKTFELLAEHNSGTREGRTYEQLAALCHQLSGNHAKAIRVYRRLAKATPTEPSGLLSRMRLAELGHHLPEPIAPQLAEPDKQLTDLPSLVRTLDSLGLDQLAQSQLKRLESQIAKRGSPRRMEKLCNTYQDLQYGRRRFELAYALINSDPRFKTLGGRKPWLWKCLYPKPFSDSVLPASEALGVPESLIYAIMRQESGFRPEVVSPAKAFGLMQVIEPTGESVLANAPPALLKRTQSLTERSTTELLKVADANIWIGTSYLAELRGQFQSRTALVASSYNAGPEATSRWIYSMQNAPVEMYIASIPYKETRHYVGKILSNEAAYLAIYPTNNPATKPEAQATRAKK